MLSVILIDDEPSIREGLKSIIDWEAHGFTICGEASNGMEGLEKICLLNPDLAIVDIKMPVMDGFQMISELRKLGNSCEYIILSAYSDFKYAQSAIDLSIGSYILKPIEQEELIEKITKVRETVLQKREAKQALDLSLSLSRSEMIQSLVLGQPMTGDCEEKMGLCGLDFPWKTYQVTLIDIENNGFDAPNLRQKIMQEVEHLLTCYEQGYVFSINQYIGLLTKKLSNCHYSRILSDLHERILKLTGLDVFISLGQPEKSLDSIKLSYQTACRLLDKKFIYGYKKIITYQQIPQKEDGRKSPLNRWDIDAVTHELYRAIDVENSEAINDQLEAIKDYFIASESDESFIKIQYSNIYTAIVSRLTNSNEALRQTLSIQQSVLTEICTKSSLQELHGYIKFVLIALSEEVARLRPADPVKKILDYVERHYSEDLKLESLAALFHYNSAYLGKLIRSKTGVQFSAYLERLRIEKAKELLEAGYKVYEVAQRTGYRYIDYFYRKFKKHVGVSPTDYKGKKSGAATPGAGGNEDGTGSEKI